MQSIFPKLSNAFLGRQKAFHGKGIEIYFSKERISKGVTFWDDHESTLNFVSNHSGVEIEYLVAILGVETYYGEKKGGYKVLDALYTLAFAYPKRGSFSLRNWVSLLPYLLLKI